MVTSVKNKFVSALSVIIFSLLSAGAMWVVASDDDPVEDAENAPIEQTLEGEVPEGYEVDEDTKGLREENSETEESKSVFLLNDADWVKGVKLEKTFLAYFRQVGDSGHKVAHLLFEKGSTKALAINEDVVEVPEECNGASGYTYVLVAEPELGDELSIDLYPKLQKDMASSVMTMVGGAVLCVSAPDTGIDEEEFFAGKEEDEFIKDAGGDSLDESKTDTEANKQDEL